MKRSSGALREFFETDEQRSPPENASDRKWRLWRTAIKN
jgi:hypothetical protein